MKNILTSIVITIVLFTTISAQNNDSLQHEKKHIFVFSIDEDIAPAMWRHTQQSFEKANTLNANLIIIKLNTYGGMVNMADSIRTKIIESKIPVYVYIENNAASAGALISIAASKIYMKKGARIGAAAVVNQTGEVMPEKYQSYMRSTMRATAEVHGKDTIIQGKDTVLKWHRDPLIAAAMVDPRIYIEDIVDSTEILTFTAQEAINNGYCEGIVEDIPDILQKEQIDDYTIKTYVPTTLEKFIRLLVSPALQGILIMIIVGGIYFELQSPGVGFPLAASILAAILYFAPLYLEGLAENWELALFVVGLILIAIEIFAIPGFGVAGILGIIFSITGLVLSMIDNIIFEFEFHALNALSIVLKSFMIVAVSMLLSVILSIYLSKKLLSTRAFSSIVLDSIQSKEEGYISIDSKMKELVGKTGIAISILRPSGRVEIDDDIYDARTIAGYIDKGEKIKVVSFETTQLYVKKEKQKD